MPTVPTATYFIYDREDVILDFEDADGVAGPNAPVPVKRYFHGPGADMILAQENLSGGGGMTGDVLWLFTDHLGTTRDILDNNGNLLNHIQYDSFGNILTQSDPTVTTRYLYTGREYEAELTDAAGRGLYYYRARFYDPSLGKFIQRDPIGFDDGTNYYEYVGSNPISFYDPSGTARKPGKNPPRSWPAPPEDVVGKNPKWNPEGYWEGKNKRRITWDDKSHGTGVNRGRGVQDGHWDEEGPNKKRWRRDGTELPIICVDPVPWWVELGTRLPDIDYDWWGQAAGYVGIAAGTAAGVGVGVQVIKGVGGAGAAVLPKLAF